MKTCPNCGERVYLEEPDGSEYGVGMVDGRQYPNQCPNCGADLS